MLVLLSIDTLITSSLSFSLIALIGLLYLDTL